MPLDFSVIEKFTLDYQEALNNKLLLRQERCRILAILRDNLKILLEDYELFEKNISSYLIDKIKRATTYKELKEFHKKAIENIKTFFLDSQTVLDVHDLLLMIRDAIRVRVLELVEEEVNSRFEFKSLPAEYAWIGLGSEGRNEETFVTDQDNMIIYGSGNGKYKTDVIEEYYEAFSKKAVDRLVEAGFKKCKAGIMPSGEKWRGSDQAWKNRLEDRIVFRKGIFKDPDIIIFSDARLVKGNKALFDEVLMFFFSLLSNNNHIMKDFIRSAVFMPTAIVFFGKFRVEKRGYYKDRFNIKLMGWIPLVMSVRMLALSNGIYNETNTLKIIGMLKEKGLIDKDMEKNLTDACLTFMNFRLMNQIKRFGCKKNGVADIDYVRPDMSGQASLEEMRMSMKSVEAFQKHIEELMLSGQPT